jgi:hypothetical protein
MVPAGSTLRHNPIRLNWKGVTLYARGRSDSPDTPEWRALRQKVEAATVAALKKGEAPG